MRNKILFWLPRILGIIMILFISLFATDVFSEGHGFWETIVALLIHLIPTFILTVILVFTWKWPRIGGYFYLLLGLSYIMTWRGHWLAFLGISGPLFLIGILFVLQKKEVE